MSKILVKYTSRQRPKRFLEGLENLYSLCANVDDIRILVTADFDDHDMFNDNIKDIVNSYKNCHIIYGTSGTKVKAINRDMNILPEGFKDWDILVNFSDDQRMSIFGWDELIRIDFNKFSPDYSHYMAYLDNDTKGVLATMMVVGRKYYEHFGFIYDEVFDSLFCDTWMEECSHALGKYIYTGYSIHNHFNPAYNYKDFPKDEMFIEQQIVGWTKDQSTYERLKKEGIHNYLKQFEK